MPKLSKVVQRLTSRSSFPTLVATLVGTFGVLSISGPTNIFAAVAAALVTVTATVTTLVVTVTTLALTSTVTSGTVTVTNSGTLTTTVPTFVTETVTASTDSTTTLVVDTETLFSTVTVPVYVETTTFIGGQETTTVIVSTTTVLDTFTNTVTVAAPTGTVEAVTVTTSEVTQDDDDDEKPSKRSESQRIKDDHTNDSNADDYHTEGNVIAVRYQEAGIIVTIATLDGSQEVFLSCQDDCPDVKVGDYISASGVKVSEQQFDADSISID